MEGEKGEPEERRNFGKWKECKYSITGSRGLNLPVGCRLFHVSKSESPLKKQKPGCPVSSRAWLLCPDPVHYDPVMPSVSVWVPVSQSAGLSACVSLIGSWSSVFSLPLLPLQLSSAVIPREGERGGEVAPSLPVHVDTLTVSRCACACVPVCACARAEEGGRSHRQQG